jgi:hypothetical protein
MDFVATCQRIADIHSFNCQVEALRKDFEAKSKGKLPPIGIKVTYAENMLAIVKIIQRLHERFYPTWQEAYEARKKLGIIQPREYQRRHKEDPRLPPSPSGLYVQDWQRRGGWHGFLDRKKLPSHKSWTSGRYQTWEQAAASCKAWKIRHEREYHEWGRRVDPNLPLNPELTYPDVWEKNGGWKGFLFWYEEPKAKIVPMQRRRL